MSGHVRRTSWGIGILVASPIWMLFKGPILIVFGSIVFEYFVLQHILQFWHPPTLQARTCNYWAWTTTGTCCSDISPGYIYHKLLLYQVCFDVAVMIWLSFSIALFLQAVLRALYAYFADRPLREIPHIEVRWPVTLPFYAWIYFTVIFTFPPCFVHVCWGKRDKDLSPPLEYKKSSLLGFSDNHLL